MIRVSELDIIYHFTVGPAQLMCKQIGSFDIFPGGQ